MRVVVTGGRGLIGSAVVERLLDAGSPQRVVVASRSLDIPRRWRGRVEVVQAFAGDALSLARAFSGADVVVHAAQFPDHPFEDPSRGRTCAGFDGQGTGMAVRVARRLGVRRFVYLSAAGAGQGRTEPWLRAKDAAEAAIRDSGLEHALLRPSWVYGPRDRSTSRLAAWCRRLPTLPVIGDGRTDVWPAFVEDVARCVALAATREDARALALDLGGPERLTFDEALLILQRVLGVRRPLVHLPSGLAARTLRWLPEPLHAPSAAALATPDVVIDPQPALDYFGLEFLPFEAGLREYLP
jgi:NADH dehydrogenase